MTDDRPDRPKLPAFGRTEAWLAGHDLVGMRLTEARELAAESGIWILDLTSSESWPRATDAAFVGYRIRVLCDHSPLVGHDGTERENPEAVIAEVRGIG